VGIKKQLSAELREDLVSFYRQGNPLYEGYCRMGPPPFLYRVFSKIPDFRIGDPVLIEIDRGAFLAFLAAHGWRPLRGKGSISRRLWAIKMRVLSFALHLMKIVYAISLHRSRLNKPSGWRGSVFASMGFQ